MTPYVHDRAYSNFKNSPGNMKIQIAYYRYTRLKTTTRFTI